jgi:hypothetical protein
MNEQQEDIRHGCCEPTCGPTTCGTPVRRKTTLRNLAIAGGLGVAMAIGGYWYFSGGHHHAARVASAELLLDNAALPSLAQVAHVLATKGFHVAKWEQTADGRVLCQISGLHGRCCVPDVETSLKTVPGVKLVKVQSSP